MSVFSGGLSRWDVLIGATDSSDCVTRATKVSDVILALDIFRGIVLPTSGLLSLAVEWLFLTQRWIECWMAERHCRTRWRW